MWIGMKQREAPVTYSAHVVSQQALRHLANIFQVTEASLSPTHRFGAELQAAPATDFRFNEFDILGDDIKWVADKQLAQEMACGILVIRTVEDYCKHMVRCSQMNPARVAEVLKLPIVD